jgi:hypothetical protein
MSQVSVQVMGTLAKVWQQPVAQSCHFQAKSVFAHREPSCGQGYSQPSQGWLNASFWQSVAYNGWDILISTPASRR